MVYGDWECLASFAASSSAARARLLRSVDHVDSTWLVGCRRINGNWAQ